MVCLGLKPREAGWKAKTNPLSYDGNPILNIVRGGRIFRQCIPLGHFWKFIFTILIEFSLSRLDWPILIDRDKQKYYLNGLAEKWSPIKAIYLFMEKLSMCGKQCDQIKIANCL